MTKVTSLEAQFFYGFQLTMENIHNETYIKDNKKQNEIYNAIETMPTIGAKAKWAEMWCNSQHALFPECLVTFAVLAEGIFSPVPSVKFFGLSNVVYSLAYVLQTSSSATMKLFTVTLHVSSTIACSNLLALSASGRLSTMPSKSKNASSTKCSHSTSWV
jgi:hypothetical protein